jgi:hypothetical protein
MHKGLRREKIDACDGEATMSISTLLPHLRRTRPKKVGRPSLEPQDRT